MNGGIRRGLHIDDDDEAKPVYEYQKLDADRKKGNFEKDLDSMLFGGMGPAPVRRRATGQTPEAKTAEQPKSVEQPKPAVTSNTPEKPKVVIAQTTPVTNSTIKPPQAPVQPAQQPVKPVQQPAVQPQQPVKPAEQPKPTTTNLNKSGDSVKNSVNISITGATVKVEAPQQGKIIAKGKEDVSVIVPSNETTDGGIKTIGLISNPKLPATVAPPAPKINNYVEPKGPDSKNVPPAETKKEVAPTQPVQYEDLEFIDRLHPFSAKTSFNKPGYVRKLKKVAEDFKFAEENVTLHSSVDVVRPFETDRTRQRKLNNFDYVDYQFPSSSVSLGAQNKAKESVWKKPNELAKTVNFGKYIDPNDIKVGTLSSPHFASTLSGLSELEANIKRVIQDQKTNSNGFYLVRLFINSVWRYVPVDSLLPFLEGENAGILSNTDSEFELSSALIEKAYAKSFGGYDVFSRLQPRENYLRDLTGAPVKKYSFDNPDIGNIIKKAVAAGQVIFAVPNEKIAALGINPNFSYSVINYSSKGNLELRNSWGTLEERSKISYKPEGTFELGSAQVRENISHILIAHLNTAYSTTTIQSTHKYGFYSSYNFKIRNNAHGFVTVSQWDERLFPVNSGYEYSPFHIILHKTEGDHTTLINAAFTHGTRNLDLEVNLTPGTYTIFVAGQWKSHEHNYNLTFYGSQRVDFERVYTDKVPNLISQSFEAVNVSNGKRTDLNKTTIQYFLYHPESNLILLTVENATDRDTSAIADLSRVKFDHLVLLTSYNNEENYGGKIAAQIEEYKHIPLTDRRWQVNLGPRERFTWILAADQAYNPENPRAWGFN